MKKILGTLSVLGFALVSCGVSFEANDNPSDVTRFQNFNFVGRSLGLKPREIALTLDDGPAGRSLELAKWLRDNNIPATFFMVGKNARQFPDVVSAIAKMNFNNGTRAFVIANHSMNHVAVPGNPIGEVGNADAILKKHIDPSRQPFLFRAPFGDFIRAASATNQMIANLNNSGDLSKYIGPIFWDLGGVLDNNHSADWACWGRNGVSMGRCIDGYVRETSAKNGGVMLTHDVHSETVDMLTGLNASGKNPARRSLIKELQAKGFSFVALDRDPVKLSQFGNVPQNQFGNAVAKIQVEGSQVSFEVTAAGADKLELWVDKLNRPLFTIEPYDGSEVQLSREFTTGGSRSLTVVAFKNGKVIARRSFGFQVPN